MLRGITISSNLRVEIEFCFPNVEATQARINELALEPVRWDVSESHPEGEQYWAVAGLFQKDAKALIVDGSSAAVELFDTVDGFCILKAVTTLGPGYYATPAWFNQKGGLFIPAQGEGKDEYVYKIPYHKLTLGKPQRFFLFVEVEGTKDRARLEIRKIIIVRGKNFVRITSAEYFFADRLNPARFYGHQKHDDLPMKQILAAYAASFTRS